MGPKTSKVTNMRADLRGIEHRMRKGEMEEKLNKEAKKGV